MTNADKFKGIFGLYATELWAKTEKEFLEWLNEDVPETNDGDMISRQAAIDAILEMNTENRVSWLDCVLDTLDALPSAQSEIVWCKDCRHVNECHKSVQYTRDEPNTITIGYSPIEWCSNGKRRTDEWSDEH